MTSGHRSPSSLPASLQLRSTRPGRIALDNSSPSRRLSWPGLLSLSHLPSSVDWSNFPISVALYRLKSVSGARLHVDLSHPSLNPAYPPPSSTLSPTAAMLYSGFCASLPCPPFLLALCWVTPRLSYLASMLVPGFRDPTIPLFLCVRALFLPSGGVRRSR